MRIILDGTIWTNVSNMENEEAQVTLTHGVDQNGAAGCLLLIITSGSNRIVVSLKPSELHSTLHIIESI